jgi:hypothetical protein
MTCWFHKSKVLCFLLAVPAFAQDDFLSRVTDIALRAQQQLPDFIATQQTKRSEDDSGKGRKWKQRDTIETEFSFVNRRPSWKLLKFNGKPTRITQLRTGFRSDGILQFFSLPGSLFGAKAGTQFEWRGWDTRDGRRIAVFSLHVPQYASQLAFTGAEGRLIVGFHGLLYADAETAQVTRLEIQAELPEDHPVHECSVEVDYSEVKIADGAFFLPVRAVVQARIGNHLAKNETEVVRYQKYAAAATLKFGDP